MAAIGTRAALVGLALSTAASGVTVIAGETLARWLAPQHLRRDEGMYVGDAGRAFKLAPGFRGMEVSGEFAVPIAINSRGLRGRETALAKPPGIFRILIVGDSFTYGSGVRAEDTYASQLERLLNRHRATAAYEVINAGVMGYGTYHEAVFLREQGWRYEPDLLIVQVFPNNDLTDNLYPLNREVRRGFVRLKAAPDAVPGWLLAIKQFLRAHSHLYRFLGDRYNLLRIRLGWEPMYAASLGVYQRQPSPEIARGWQLTQEYLAQIAGEARERGVAVLVVHAPKNVVLDSQLQTAFVRFHRVDPADLDWDLPATRLAALCRVVGLPFLDLVAQFRAAGRPLDLYYPENGHWNPRGHAEVARWIFERLEGDGMFRGRRPA